LKHIIKQRAFGQLTAAILAFVGMAVLAASPALADDEVLAKLIGRWVVSTDGSDDLSLSEITIEQTGSGLIIASKGSTGSERTEYEPASDGDFLRAEGSGDNPVMGKAAQWVRVDGDGIHVHRMESTKTGGIDIVSEELFLADDAEAVMRYRRLAFTDGVSTGISAGTFDKQE